MRDDEPKFHGELEQFDPYWNERRLLDDDELTEDEGFGECPCCGAIFGFDEVARGRCFSCGWHEGEECEEEDD